MPAGPPPLMQTVVDVAGSDEGALDCVMAGLFSGTLLGRKDESLAG